MYTKKYGNNDFSDIIGRKNKIIAKSIKAHITNGTLPQAIMFTGSRGCGKTTMANLIAKELGVSEDDFTFAIINASDERGINAARDFNLQSKIPAFTDIDGNGNKLFFFDESHGVTKDFQEAILATVGKPPKGVYVIFCTSKPDDLDPALRDRFIEYEMSQCNSRELEELLNHVIGCENLEISATLINKIANVSDGSPRVALKNLYKIHNIKDEEEANELLVDNELETEAFREFIKDLVNGKSWQVISKHVKNFKNYNKVREGLLTYISTWRLNLKLKNDKEKFEFDKIMLIYEAFSEPFEQDGQNGRNGFINSCAMCML